MSLRFHQHFLNLSVEWAKMSKDPSTKVGAVIVDDDWAERSTGYNGLPRGIADTAERLHNRALKLELVVHAEENAICNAARIGVSTKGCTMYLSAMSYREVEIPVGPITGFMVPKPRIWGGAPCTRCTVSVIQCGIRRIVTRPFKDAPSRWAASLDQAKALLQEAGVEYLEIPFGEML